MSREGEGAVVRQGRSIALVVAFLIGCAVFLMAGASVVQAQASKNEEARCEGTRKINVNLPARYTTNDLPGCPQGGLLLGTDKPDELDGLEGDDEIRGLGAKDALIGGLGSDVIYGGPGNDDLIEPIKRVRDASDDVFYGGGGDDHLAAGKGEDVMYGGDGNDELDDTDGQRGDKLYCGKGTDRYVAGKNDYVDSSCEKKARLGYW